LNRILTQCPRKVTKNDFEDTRANTVNNLYNKNRRFVFMLGLVYNIRKDDEENG